ncbi:UDP-2,3-diacylglucosamine diphosphatase [Tistrella bauzanensis]|jgi:UDP-2,3-diacylglucosamine pyrophosphatase LpxH|uniref:UDP-2,3-diacylglucosamine diphosphatase n=1 Tax=Tistrella arctica TaxID=3133430 RepID=A0ABU9YF39_9PROT
MTVARALPPLAFRPDGRPAGQPPHQQPPRARECQKGHGGDNPGGDGGSGGDGGGRRRYRTVFISDTHLGTRFCRTDLLLDFLATVDCDHLFLVGDIVDGWRLKRSWFWDGPHNAVVQAILAKAEAGTRVTWVIGNHDECLMAYAGMRFGNITLVRETEHRLADGRKFLIVHGDAFDMVVRYARGLALLGDVAYNLALRVNRWLNVARRQLHLPYWSLSAYLKSRVKEACDFINRFEQAVTDEARRRGYDGVVCGHIHHADIRETEGMVYANDGDWVESCTAIVEDACGRLQILDWGARARRRELVALARARTRRNHTLPPALLPERPEGLPEPAAGRRREPAANQEPVA